MTATAATELRSPQTSSREVMTRRAWMLVVLNVVVPGSAQHIAGSKRLGKFGLWCTGVLAATGALLGLGYLVSPVSVYTVATLPLTLTVFQGAMLFYAALWVILTLDTLRLVRLVRTLPRARAWVAGVAVVLMSVFSGGAAYASYVVSVQRSAVEGIFTPAVPPAAPIDGRYNILLLGGDAGPDREGMRPDSLSVVSIDAQTGQATIFGIPRDLQQVPLPAQSPLTREFPNGVYACGSDCQISFLYPRVEAFDADLYPDAEARGSLSGIEATKDAVEGALGLPLQYYVLIDMQGFSDLIDALGGVDIEVAERQPIGGDEELNEVEGWIEAGPQHMDGYTALWYARSRHATSDYDRMQRQRQLQEAILAQFDPANVLSKFEAIASAGEQVVKTDIPQSMLGYFVDLAMKTKDQPIDKIELTPPLVDPEDPNFAEIHRIVQRAVAAKPPVTNTPAP